MKDNGTTGGKYMPVNGPYSGRKHSVREKVAKLAPMVALLLGAAVLMVAHHIFNSHLNEKRIDPGSTELPPLLQSQRNVSIIGTTIAHGARIFLSLAIGATFGQMFWETLRSRRYNIAQIDALHRCGQSPFHPSALRAASASFTLFVVSLVASATALIVVLSPGSLTIDSGFQRRKPCIVPTVPSDAIATSDSNVTLVNSWVQMSVMSNIITTNTYFPPFRTPDLSVACEDVTTSCSYNISFIGPAMDCTDITDQTNFTTFLTPTGDPPNQVFWIWNSTFGDSNDINLTILSRDLEKGLVQATNCTAYNATYDVGVSFLGGSTTVEVWDITPDVVLPWWDDSFVSAYGSLAALALPLSCRAGQNVPSDCTGSIFETTSAGNFTLGDTTPHFVTSFIQNITISLLSGTIYYGYSNDTSTNFEYVQSTCSSIVAVYVYNSTRLLATYGVTMAISTMVTAYGFYLILRNDVERDFLFSHLAGAALNEDMLSLSKDMNRVHGGTQVQLFRKNRTDQTLMPMSPNHGPSTVPIKSRALRIRSALGDYLGTSRSKMLLLILSAVGCMVLNHAYYSYLDGKGPTSSLHISISSGLALNQTIASDIGVALAYAGQTLLAVAIGTSCAQLFWSVMRHRGHTVYEVDSLIKAQTSTFSFSLLSALRASLGVSLLSLLAASTSLISIFAPGSLKVASDHKQFEECTVLSPQNLSALTINTTSYDRMGGNVVLLSSVASLGTYLSPINICGSGLSTSNCSYDLEFVGPGFSCEDVTGPSNNTAFATSSGSNFTTLYIGEVLPQNITDAWQISIQTWDSVYQAITCTAILRSYTASISHATVSTIKVTDSPIFSTVHANLTQPILFAENYLSDMMEVLNDNITYENGQVRSSVLSSWLSQSGGIGTLQLDGNITWNQNMSHAVEDFAQNATLSLLSGQVATRDPDVSNVLENFTTTCTYTFPAYEYAPGRLFLTYGIGILVTILCALWGSITVRRNGVEESMDFSRFLGAILNEKMYDARRILDKDTIIKADETAEGSFAPVDS